MRHAGTIAEQPTGAALPLGHPSGEPGRRPGGVRPRPGDWKLRDASAAARADLALTGDERAALLARAAFLWPGLDRRRLRRTGGDPWKVARLVGRRTAYGEETIVRLLLMALREP